MAEYRQVDLNDVKRAKGGYILLAFLSSPCSIQVGKLGTILFPGGSYAYLGSALAGFKSRIGRHLHGNMRLWWHIDYLLAQANLSRAILCETDRRLECLLAQSLVTEIPFIPGFGSSDCHCQSHLFGACDEESLNKAITKAVNQTVVSRETLTELKGFFNEFSRLSNTSTPIKSKTI